VAEPAHDRRLRGLPVSDDDPRRKRIGAPDQIAAELADAAVALADTVLMTVPNQLGVEYNAELLRNIAAHVAPAIGWRPATVEV
jgi:alkanesulfonate monooxygenase SsuD/methylene tetrahydromethanopterin reductase-like flavin-dependent oxidoreductase (luciferase family)